MTVTAIFPILIPLCLLIMSWAFPASAGSIIYIHGDVAADGSVPSGADKEPYDQMLLTDSGNTGLSQFRQMVIAEGHTISQRYDQTLTLNASFLASVDVLIFGLHQKIWSSSEKSALDSWLRAGGGIFIYNDSASGGRFSIVGAQNPVGQNVVKNLMLQYGIQVTVDQANGVKAYRSSPGSASGLMSGRPVLEGEGVSPIAYLPGSGVVDLIPYVNGPDNTVSGNATVNQLQGLSNPGNLRFSALVTRNVGSGRIVAMFDRQPMWNNGPGSDINERDNKEILRRVMNYLAASTGNPPTPPPTPSPPSGNGSKTAVNGSLLLLLD